MQCAADSTGVEARRRVWVIFDVDSRYLSYELRHAQALKFRRVAQLHSVRLFVNQSVKSPPDLSKNIPSLNTRKAFRHLSQKVAQRVRIPRMEAMQPKIRLPMSPGVN